MEYEKRVSLERRKRLWSSHQVYLAISTVLAGAISPEFWFEILDRKDLLYRMKWESIRLDEKSSRWLLLAMPASRRSRFEIWSAIINSTLIPRELSISTKRTSIILKSIDNNIDTMTIINYYHYTDTHTEPTKTIDTSISIIYKYIISLFTNNWSIGYWVIEEERLTDWK